MGVLERGIEIQAKVGSSAMRIATLEQIIKRQEGVIENLVNENKYFNYTVYVAWINGKKFHRSDCKHAGEIRDEHRIEFETHEEAVAAGKKPCGQCCP